MDSTQNPGEGRANWERFGCASSNPGAVPLVHFDHIVEGQRYHLRAVLGSFSLLSFILGPLTKAGLAVVRVSGKDAFQAVKAMTKSASPFPEMRKASLRSILDSQSKELIDRGLVLCFQEGSR